MAVDSNGYYAALGLSPGASLEVVRAVYRQLAKECHPDRPGCRDGGERFRRITEAYDALSDATFKSNYDQGAEQAPSDRVQPSPQIDPVRCQVCSAITAQPRRLAFWRVTSFILFSQKNPKQGIYCRDCAAKEQWKSTVWTSLLGWWGIPWGPPWSIMHGVTNATGGTREPEIDEALMWQNALAFAMRGEGSLAVGLSNILRKSDNVEIGRKSADIIGFFADQGIDPTTTLNDVWKRSFLKTTALLATAFLVPAAALAFVAVPSKGFFSSQPSDAEPDLLSEVFGPDAQLPASETSTQGGEAPLKPAPPPEQTCDVPPANGELLVDNRSNAGSGHQLEIDNGTSGDAIIKVRSAGSDRTLASFFVSRGRSATLKNIPDGAYSVQYANGDKLAANCRTFINDGTASASEFPGPETLETRYEETLEGTRVARSRLSYTLYSVPGGNVHPSDINMDEFNKP